MARFSTRNIFKDPNQNPDEPEGDLPEFPNQEGEGDSAESIEWGADGGSAPDTGDPIEYEEGNGEVAPEAGEFNVEDDEPESPMLPVYPTTLAKGTFSLPGSGTFRQYQSPDDRAEPVAGIADDMIRRRLRRR